MESQHAQDVRLRLELEQRAAAAESQAAQKLIDEFLAQAVEQHLQPEPLRATTYKGAKVKTDRTGWYLKRDGSVAIGTDGGYYILTVPDSLRARFAGVHVEPTPPPLVVARGARDGESGDLSSYLALRLAAG